MLPPFFFFFNSSLYNRWRLESYFSGQNSSKVYQHAMWWKEFQMMMDFSHVQKPELMSPFFSLNNLSYSSTKEKLATNLYLFAFFPLLK